MDNPPASATEWGPKPAGIAAAALVGVAFGIAVFFVSDAPGRLLATVAALGLLGFAAVSWRCRPKLRIVDEGLELQGLTRVTLLPRATVHSVKVTEFRRLGRRTRLLEIESGDDLLVLNRWDLGTDPRDVHEALRAARYRA
ncbi:PH domain-containing protein [Mycobacterium sp. D16R24]|uniref:PH domain-containing protein n=1 Tax=Mycobacterium sp. D16R24 TaxID=1855656 RepID=UPI0009941857|nr:PH domain-containing protein [Mycobacterium sp. D16R24]